MKISIYITAALVALGIVSQAGASTTVYLTGSTAFRSTLYAALSGTSVFDAPPSLVTYGSATASKANYMVFHGTINSTNDVYINCAWSGSEAGIASAANTTLKNTDRDGNLINLAGSPETWLDITKVTLDGSTISTNPGSALMETNSHGADLAQADTSQAVSFTPYVAGTQTALKDYGVQGIVPFTFVKNYNSSPSTEWSSLVNVSLPQVNVLFGHGYEPTAFFTGTASQTNQYVYLVGRNKGSGTRANELADTGYGTTKSVTQFSIGEGIEQAAVTNLVLDYENNNGYESGGNVATALSIDGSCGQTDPFFPSHSGWYAIGFLGCSDATSTKLTPNWLTADGVMESDGAVEEGQYYLWGHQHLFGKYQISGVQDITGSKILTGVQNYLTTTLAGATPSAHSAGIALTYMHCDKASDVAYPTRN